jgi:hypothetical protein
MYYTCDHPQRFLPEVKEALTAFENRLIAEQDTVAATSEALFAAGKRELALEFLTDHSERAGQDALELGHALLGSIEARTELLYGLRLPEGEAMSGMDTPGVSCGEAGGAS